MEGSRRLFWIVAIGIQWLTSFEGVQGQADPFITFLLPEAGPDKGGYDISIVGRNLAFLDDEVKVFVNGKSVIGPKVEFGWERVQIKMPYCDRCGVVPIRLKVGSALSNVVNFTYTNDCVGPVLPPKYPIIPPPFSASENCTVCTEVVALTQGVMPDKSTYQSLKEAMHGTCDTVHFTRFTYPPFDCHTDLSPACKILVQSMTEAILDAMWALWDKYYFYGMLPNAVCQVIKRCDKNKNY
mmetsp:Transcript_10185/g.32190  ORF Transcript_10185/g.32190 Transcript_10185/m.32190 type:complete len:240 (+) Transcript_10185:22-741(+)